MNPVLIDIEDIDSSDLYRLVKNIYTTSEGMSEYFEQKFPDEATCGRYFSEMKNIPGAVVLFTAINNEPTGYLVLKPRQQAKIRHTSELNMGVHSGFRGNGIGKFLLTQAMEIAGDLKLIEIVYLMVRTDNIPAIRLYEKFCFEKLATLKRDTKIGNRYFDGILMRKFIDNR